MIEIKKLADDFVKDVEGQIDEFIPKITEIVIVATTKCLKKCPDEHKEELAGTILEILKEKWEREVQNL